MYFPKMLIRAFNLAVLAIILPPISASAIVAELDHQNRISNGQTAEEGQFPYQVSVQHIIQGHICGGSIIGSKWILTAAHCLDVVSPKELIIYMGSVRLNSTGKSAAISYKVAGFIQHDNYIQLECMGELIKIKNDIGLIKLEKEIKELKNSTESTKIIANITLETNFVGGNVPSVISGWGLLRNDTYPDTLQYLNTKTLTNEKCDELTEMDLPPLYPTQICTLVHCSKSTRYRDSGGPLVVNGKQIGIVSTSSAEMNDTAVTVNVYTRVAPYIPWIEHIMSTKDFL